MSKANQVAADAANVVANQNEEMPVVAAPIVPANAQNFDPNSSASHLLHRAQQVAADMHLEAFGTSGLTPRQVAVLAVLSVQGSLKQADLVDQTGIDRSTLAEMVARMEARGLLARKRSEADSRAKLVSLAPEGEAAILDAGPKLLAIDKAVLGLLSLGNRRILIELLRTLGLPPIIKPEKSIKPTKEVLKLAKKSKKKKERKKKKA